MSIAETIVVFGGIPLAVIAVVVVWAYAASGRSAPRYRPGRPFTFTPVWYLAAPDGSRQDESTDVHPLPAATPAASARGALSTSTPHRSGDGGAGSAAETGGARGTW